MPSSLPRSDASYSREATRARNPPMSPESTRYFARMNFPSLRRGSLDLLRCCRTEFLAEVMSAGIHPSRSSTAVSNCCRIPEISCPAM